MSETTYTYARAHFKALCDEVAEGSAPVVIRRRRGQDVALVSAAELRSLEETAHLVRSPRNLERLLVALERARAGKGRRSSAAALRRRLGLERED